MYDAKANKLSKDVPCIVISTFKPSDGCSKAYQVFDENNLSIQNGTWQDGIPFCQFTWDITTLGTNIYNSSIQDGAITIEKKDNMLSIILVQMCY